jgi:hypothetical protein
MNPFMRIWSIIATSLYIHSVVYIPLQLLRFSQFLVFFEMQYRTEAEVCQDILKQLYKAQLKTVRSRSLL